jgi:hypothetical protein
MKLPRFLGNIVRAGSSPEIVTTRNFDELANVLEGYAQGIEGNSAGLDAIVSKVAKLIPPALLGKGAIYDVRSFGTLDKAVTYIGANTATLYVTNAQTLTANLTIPSNISIVVLKGGSFGGSFTLTLSGQFDAGNYRVFLTGLTVGLSADSCPFIKGAWFGADPASLDNTDAINTALVASASTSAFRPGILRLGGGAYLHSNPILIPQRNVIFEGAGAGSTRLRYTGTTFQNGIEIDTAGEGFIKWRDMELQCTGKGKYAFRAVSLNEGCEIDLSIRNYTGMAKVESGYLSTINLRCQSSAWDAVTSLGISQAEWETVHGTDSGPLYFSSMNACTVRLKTFRVGSIVTGGVTPFSVMYVKSSTGLDLKTPNFEWGFGTGSNPGDVAYDSFEEDGVTYPLRATSALFMQYVVGTVTGMRTETMQINNLIKLKGECNVQFLGLDDYGNYSVGDRFVNEAGHDAIVDGYKATDSRAAGVLFKDTDSGVSASQGWILRSANIAYGKRYKQTIANGGPNDDSDNTLDTFAFSGTEKLGCADDLPRLYNADRLYIPKILTGYVVTAGTMTNLAGNRYTPADAASVGDYVNITPGVMLREDGTFVDSKRGTAALVTTGLEVNYRLRPITASKWYRVFIGRAGQPYLVEYASDPVATPEGNWIAGFATDASLAITGLANNLRLGYNGMYTPNTLNVTLKDTAAPATGYWRKGDRVENSSPNADDILEWICTTAGASGAWTPQYNAARRLPKVLYSSTTVVGNVGAGVDTLDTYTVPAGTLSTNGDFLRICAWGEFAANANTKQVKADFDTHTLFASGGLALNGTSWRLDVTLSRVSATTQRGTAGWVSSDTLLRGSSATTNPARTLANALVFKITGEATANDDIIQRGMIVEFIPGS